MPLSAALGAILISTPAAAARQDDNLWDGFYVGINLGGAFSNSDADATLSTVPGAPVPANPIAGGDITGINAANASRHFGSKHHNTFTGGLEGGYNYVTGSGFLFGIETDIDLFNIKASKSQVYQSPVLINPPVTYTVNQSINTDFLFTLRPRIGYTFDNFLVFGSAGLALSETHYKASFIDSRTGANSVLYKKSKTQTGWTLGGGLAYAISREWEVKAEYLYQHYGTDKEMVASTNGYLNLATEEQLRTHLFRAGVDYHF